MEKWAVATQQRRSAGLGRGENRRAIVGTLAGGSGGLVARSRYRGTIQRQWGGMMPLEGPA